MKRIPLLILTLLILRSLVFAQTPGDLLDAAIASQTARIDASEARSLQADSETADALEALSGQIQALDERITALEQTTPAPDLLPILIHAFGDERQPAGDASATTHADFAALHDLVILRSENADKVAAWRETNPDLTALLWLNYPMRADGDSSIALDCQDDAPILRVGESPVLLRGWERQHSGLHDLRDAVTRIAKAHSAAARLAGLPFDGVFLDNALVTCRAEALVDANSRTLIAGGMTPVIPDGYRGDRAEALDVADGIHQVIEAVDLVAINPGVIAGQVDLINAIGADWVIEEHAFTGDPGQVWDQIQAARAIASGRMLHAYLPEPYFSDPELRRFWWACLACCRTESAPLSASLYPVAADVAASRAAYQESWPVLAEECAWIQSLGAVLSLGRVGDIVTAEFTQATLEINLRSRSVEVR